MNLTFALLVLALLAVGVVLDTAVLHTGVLRSGRFLRVAGYLVVVTLVFDNLLSFLPVYVFDHSRTLGIFLPFAPIEDLGYIVAVVLLVAVLDRALRRVHRLDPPPGPADVRHDRGSEPDADRPEGAGLPPATR